VIRPAAPEVVARHPAVILVTGFCRGDLGGVLDPVLYRSLLSIDERVVVGEVVLLDLRVGLRLEIGWSQLLKNFAWTN
jgi:hypothetical protein